MYGILDADILVVFRMGRLLNLASISYVVPLYILALSGYISDIKVGPDFKKSIIKTVNLAVISVLLVVFVPFISLAIILGLVYIVMACAKAIKIFKANEKVSYVKISKALIVFSVFAILLLIGIGNNNVLLVDRSNPTKFLYEDDYYTIHQEKIIQNAKLFGTAVVEKREGATGLQNGTFEDFVEIGTDYALLSILGHYGWGAFALVVSIILLLNVFLLLNVTKIRDEYGKMIGTRDNFNVCYTKCI